MAVHLLRRSTALFDAMMAERRARAAGRPADPCSSANNLAALAALAAAVNRLPPELPGLSGFWPCAARCSARTGSR